MVGLNPFASRHNSAHPGTPPPSYKKNDPSSLLFAETTVTTTEVVTTTTQTTTHFFSLPHWRRRAAPLSYSDSTVAPQKPIGHARADEMGLTNSFQLTVDKELPPTPEGSSGHGTPLTNSHEASRRSSLEQETLSSTLFPSSNIGGLSLGGSPRTSTSALAQASLGLSLPHVLPHASASSSSTDLNSIAFTSTPSSEIISPRKDPRGRMNQRAVSTTGQSSLSDVHNQRRARGLSLGPSGFLGLGTSDVKGKGKETEKETYQLVTHTPTKLTRRASFWSKKKISSPDSLPAARKSDVNLVPLPALPPLSPFNVDMMKSSSTDPASQSLKPHHARTLSRSHSERSKRSSPKTSELPTPGSMLSPPVIPKSEGVRRPSTADTSYSRPKSSRFISIGSSEQFSSSPLASPAMEKNQEIFPLPEAPPPSKRPRAQTNPPLLRRLSMNLFSPSSNNYSYTSPSTPILVSPSPLRTSTSKPTQIPKPQMDEESPEVYLSRLMVSVGKAEIGGILASSNDMFHVQALRSYIGRFDFANDPLDVALRRLLMDVGLPRETQQIDRVMEAFASHYYQLHPSLFTSQDQPYVLSFSLIMLHTDAFNKSNKRKMTKPDYIKNTRMPGVAPEVLDCFYDNIVFAPFIFVEDPVDVNGQRGFNTDGSRGLSSGNSSGNANGSMLLGKGNKVDPYYLISNNLLNHLRIDVEMFVPLVDPYRAEGTGGPWNEEELRRAFVNPNVIEMGSLDSSRAPPLSPFFSAGGSTSGPFAMGSELHAPGTETWRLKVTKVGSLNRKDDILEGGKKASNRKWKSFSVVLTGSQLLFLRDPTWATAFLNQNEAATDTGFFPQTAIFTPNEVISMKNAVAVYDSSYLKHDDIFRLALADGRQFLFETESQLEMNEWISRINYASAFKSAGVQMRPIGMSGQDVQLTGVAAATSHLHDLQHQNKSDWDSETSRDLMEMLSGDSDTSFRKGPPKRRVTNMSSASDMDNDVPVAPEIDGADQFKATFDQVKADLAAGRCASPDDESPTGEHSPGQTQSDEHGRLPSRSRAVFSKVRELESKMSASQTQLESDLRFVRNVATLTPFQRSTRERLTIAVQNIAKRIMQVRLNLARDTCHRRVLLNDMNAEGENWSRAKKMALRAATETLQSHQPSSVPRMTLSFHESNSAGSPQVSIPSKTCTPSMHKSESTAGSLQSFHSAFDFESEWYTADDVFSSDHPDLDAFKLSSSLRNSSRGSSDPDLKEEDEIAPLSSRERSSDVTSPRTSNNESNHHEKYYTARESMEEQAEEWNKTRCAHRVSLVRVPSAIGLARKFEREQSR
ncbi:hypothetical protein J3R30DRAFT_3697837 [Lentinula aciculospora]|uniref:Uncharacterized protein n=1 Tax=Lentinula aciculospora TaxID=153920 RepID=A0A9W9DU56_9AGAR|nr:hypothetical protein J3R30DRAFT_3697837 [Lentinula aciculospora]